ncbi:branched-chain amino acid ABC transporter permease [Methylobacterium sp. WSM2598]|uniref:branched-chain amino acid ABC transporter permease n=1 Tax=Methylobacterium sp. WSM2598 TaxID=398261 RepID=UPI00036B2AB0|nr:branched-chain amino acid ABC transporter permease [Methylobacterium sp. WSM2598]
MSDTRQLVLAAVLLAAALAAPAFVGNYWLRVLTTVFMFGVVAQGLNVIVGFAGYHAFGNSVFFGIGAYATGVGMTLGLPVWIAVPVAVLAATLVAAILGWPLLRLRGHYFAIATVALNAAATEAIINIGGVTGGAQGLPLPFSALPPTTLYRIIYFAMLAALVLATGVVFWLSRSRLGYALRALRDSEDGAEVMGVDTVRAKILAWMISAAMTGAVGGLWAYWLTFIEVGTAFDVSISVRGYVMMLLGGMGTVIGPVIGAALFQLVGDAIWSHFSGIHNLLLGALVMAVVLMVPRGLLDSLSRLRPPARRGRRPAEA